jgi:hypothetical protein
MFPTILLNSSPVIQVYLSFDSASEMIPALMATAVAVSR